MPTSNSRQFKPSVFLLDTTSSESVGTTHPPVLQEIPLSETVATTLEPAPMAKSVQVVAGPEIPDIVVPADTLHVGPRVDMRRSSVQSGPMVDSLTLSPTAAMRRASAPANRVNTSPDSLEGHIEVSLPSSRSCAGLISMGSCSRAMLQKCLAQGAIAFPTYSTGNPVYQVSH